jgi:outer membrane protein assembly factor BamB
LCIGQIAVGVTAQETMNHTARWPQFRGPNGAGVAASDEKLPVDFGPAKYVWRTPLPQGLSSPCVWGDWIFLTGHDQETNQLETLCIDGRTGRLRWRRVAPTGTIEETHIAGGAAAPTPATDGQRVYVYFGSHGLLCYDYLGRQLWTRPLPVPFTEYGAGSSPVLVRDWLLLVRDQHQKTSCLLVVDCDNGQTVRTIDRPLSGRGWSTPMTWRHDQGEETVVLGSHRLAAYDLTDGSERWSLRGLAGHVISTPVAGEGMLFVSAWNPGGDLGEQWQLPDFAAFARKYDRNRDDHLNRHEIPSDYVALSRPRTDQIHNVRLRDMFSYFDWSGDGRISRAEWNGFVADVSSRENKLVAIRAGGRGNLTKAHIAWEAKHGLPEVPSPLYYDGCVYLVKDGGIASCYDAKTGRLHYLARLGPGGPYYASPIAGDGKIYVASLRGVVVVYGAGDTLNVLARNDFGEQIVATPAIVGGMLYVRTSRHLYALGDTAHGLSP